MFARSTRYKIKPESTQLAIATLNQMKDQIMVLPGMIHFVNTMNSDGSGCDVSVVESGKSPVPIRKRLAGYGRFLRII